MLELLLVLVFLAGQIGLVVSLHNRVLMNADASRLRTVAMIFSPVVLVGIPALGVVLLYHRGALADLAHFRGPAAAVGAMVCYGILAAAGIGRYLWVSLVVLPRRQRPSILGAHCRSIHHYQPPMRPRAGTLCGLRPLRAMRRLNCLFDLEVNRYFLRLPGLPEAFEGFSIVQLSDFHATRSQPEDWLEFVAAMVAQLRPDLIVLGGDYIARARDLECVRPLLLRLRAPEGVWAIRGNHDFWEAADTLPELFAQCGVGFLRNRRIEIARGGQTFDLIGIEAPWDHDQAWRGLFPLSPDRLSVVVSHTPDMAVELAGCGAALMIAGHTHGGQVCLPVVGSLLVPSRFGKRFDQGWFAMGKLALYVNRGVGSHAPRIRLLCRPEIAQFVFCRAPS